MGGGVELEVIKFKYLKPLFRGGQFIRIKWELKSYGLRIYISHQCSKLSIYSVHTQGAERPRIVHPAISLCAQAYIRYRNTLK